MSGHSKWATIKRKKGANDAKRGAIFTKHAKNIAVAARNGKDPDMNPALRTAIDKAKGDNMPKDNMEKAILKGAGEIEGAIYEELVFEGYGPGGAALIVECVTDNTNRTVSSVRSAFTKAGGSIGSSGSVLYMFENKGIIRVAADKLGGTDADALELTLIDAGAEDIVNEEEGLTVTTGREQLNEVVNYFSSKEIVPDTSGLEWVTGTMIQPSEGDVIKIQQLIEVLEDNDDVNNVYTNAEV